MSTPDYSDVEDTSVPHEAEHAEATDAQMRRTSDHGPIADLPASPAAYDAVADQAVRTTVNEILAVLRDAELIPIS